MTATDDPSDKPQAPPAQTETVAPETVAPEAGAPRGQRGRVRTFTLGLILSGVLLALAVGYLLLAPSPVAVPAAPPSPAQTSAVPDNTLRFVVPRSVITPELLRDFEAESGVSVELLPYDNEEMLLGLSTPSPLNADVILAAGVTIQSLRERLAVMPVRLIGNVGLIDPALRSLSTQYDKDGLRAVPYAWTTYGLGLNREAAAAQLGPAAPIDTWALMFDAALAARLKVCGLHSISAPSIAFPLALKYLGVPHNSDAPADTERASAVWEGARAYVGAFDSRAVETALAGGQACAVLASAADVHRARAAARDAGQTFTVEFVMPREGTLLRLYMLAIPRASPKTAKAAALVDYLLRPDVSARLTNTRFLANAVPGSLLYVRQDIKDDAVLMPDTGTFSRLTPEANPSPAIVGLRERFWQLIAGQ